MVQFLRLDDFVLLLTVAISIAIGTANGDDCPKDDDSDCECEMRSGLVSLDCTGKDFIGLPSLLNLQTIVHTIDMSDNHLTEFPEFNEEMPLLSTLDLSANQVQRIAANSLQFLPSLRVLFVNNNNISNWIDINPNVVLQSAPSLEKLILAGNSLTSLTSVDQSFILTSPSLKVLDLSDCKITKITGQHVLQGLPKLEMLIMRGNPLRSISDIHSDSLLSLDLSDCKLTTLQPSVFNRMGSLTYLNLARNHRISLTRKVDEFVQSGSLKRIDLSYCNMDSIELAGFPTLMTAILRGNLISRIKKDSFEVNVDLENIDLSSNAITHISSTSFRDLKQLKHLDLSFNMIRRIERETFKDNAVLTSINLSRNFIERFNRISARSLTHLNVSWCEILNVDLDAFNDMPELIDLDMANNLFTEFPSTLQSRTLQRLDLSMCRLSNIRNNSFEGFPELSAINLGGNRFTTAFRVEYFDDNQYLREMWMGDNPWRCDCSNKDFFKLFIFLNEHPMKLNDIVRCHSPEEVYGLTWEDACAREWNAEKNQAIGTAQRVWTFLMVAIVVLCGFICVGMSIRRCIEGRKLTQREEERVRNLEESREIMRRNRQILDQEAQLNAPDPRESRPPCYEDAILLPRLNGSFASLRKIKSDDTVDEADSSLANRRNRSRSEEVLTQRDSLFEQTRLTRRQIIDEANNRISIYPVLEIPPRAGATVGEMAATATTSAAAAIDVPIQIFDGSASSPYAQRKSVAGSTPTENVSINNQPNNMAEIHIVDNHYGRTFDSSSTLSSDSDSLSRFTIIN